MREGMWPIGRQNTNEQQREYAEFGLPVVRRKSINGSGGRLVECEKEGTHWKRMLERQEKDFLEIAGPSLFFVDDEIINFNEYADRLTCSNVTDDFTMRNQDGNLVSAKEHVDVIADAAQLPFPDHTFGALFARNFRMEDSKRLRPKPSPESLQSDQENNEYIRKVVKEAYRVLDKDGMVVWLNLERADFQSLINGGFEPIFYQQREYANGRNRYQGVFRKKEER